MFVHASAVVRRRVVVPAVSNFVRLQVRQAWMERNGTRRDVRACVCVGCGSGRSGW
jgi:hypothetical protein